MLDIFINQKSKENGTNNKNRKVIK